jgi:hypothetical protein
LVFFLVIGASIVALSLSTQRLKARVEAMEAAMTVSEAATEGGQN